MPNHRTPRCARSTHKQGAWTAALLCIIPSAAAGLVNVIVDLLCMLSGLICSCPALTTSECNTHLKPTPILLQALVAGQAACWFVHDGLSSIQLNVDWN